MPTTLLLADDSSTIQRVVELTFADEGIRVVTVDDGEQAVQSIDREPPDIVLADVGMPRLDGYSVSAHVKTSPGLQHIPVLLLAGAFEPVDQARARSAGCDGVLIKPFEPRLLVARVQELLDAARARQTAAGPGHDGAVAATSGPDSRESTESPERRDATPAGTPAPAYRPERPVGADRPEPLVIDAEDLDRHLAELTPADAAPTIAARAIDPVPDPLVSSPMPVAPAPMPAGATAKISLATAFSALLAAEQSTPVPGLPAGLSEIALENVVRRVLLSDREVRRIVLDATERMVREEIERIKALPEPVADLGPGTE
jgi:CheY-like chemotaxis protein